MAHRRPERKPCSRRQKWRARPTQKEFESLIDPVCERIGHSSLCGLRGPRGKVVRGFQDLDWNLIIIFERLIGSGFEGFHASVAIARCGRLISLKIQTSLVDDPDELLSVVQSVSSEHGAAGQVW